MDAWGGKLLGEVTWCQAIFHTVPIETPKTKERNEELPLVQPVLIRPEMTVMYLDNGKYNNNVQFTCLFSVWLISKKTSKLHASHPL